MFDPDHQAAPFQSSMWWPPTSCFAQVAPRIVVPNECSVAGYVTVLSDDVSAIASHLGDASSGEESHSFMCEAVSAWRARRNSNSRAVLPGGCSSAAFLNRAASSARRSSKEVWC